MIMPTKVLCSLSVLGFSSGTWFIFFLALSPVNTEMSESAGSKPSCAFNDDIYNKKGSQGLHEVCAQTGTWQVALFTSLSIMSLSDFS